MTIMTKTLQIKGRPYAVGMWWQVPKKPAESPKAMLLAAQLRAKEFPDAGYNSAAIRRFQYGLGHIEGKRTRKLAALAAALNPPVLSFLGIFCLEGSKEDGLWWVCGIRQGIIAGNGDSVWDNFNDAHQASVKLLSSMRTCDQRETWDTPEASINAISLMLRPDARLEPLFPEPLVTKKRVLLASGVLAAASVLFGLNHYRQQQEWEAASQNRNARQAVQASRRAEIEANVDAFFSKPWEKAPATAPFINSCVQDTTDRASRPSVRTAFAWPTAKAWGGDMDSSLLQDVPEIFVGKVGFSEGKLYIAESVQFEPDILSFISLAERKGVTEFEWVSDSEFQEQIKTLPSSKKMKSNSSIANYAKNLLQAAYEQNASDIHLTDIGSQTIIRFRRMGLLCDYTILPGDTGRRLIRAFYQVLGQGGQGEFSPLESQDTTIVKRKFLPPDVYSVRVHTNPTVAVEAPSGVGTYMDLRLLYDSIEVSGSVRKRLKALGYSSKDAKRIELLTQRKGLVVIAGQQNSGKSTVLKHIMEGQAEERPEKNYVSIEDPAEYPMRNVKQVYIPLGNSDAFKKALKDFLRMDANKLMPGEIRTPEAADMVLEATLTGHSVWTTLHALDAFEIITRLRNLLLKSFPGDPLETICNYNVVAGLIYQCLLPTLCPHCKQPLQDYLNRENKEERAHILPDAVYRRLFTVLNDLSKVHVRGPGCEHCKKQGLAGRSLAVEVVVTDEELMRRIRDGKHDEARAYWKEELGGRTYIDHAIELIASGEADPLLTELELGAPLNISKAIEDLNNDDNEDEDEGED